MGRHTLTTSSDRAVIRPCLTLADCHSVPSKTVSTCARRSNHPRVALFSAMPRCQSIVASRQRLRVPLRSLWSLRREDNPGTKRTRSNLYSSSTTFWPSREPLAKVCKSLGSTTSKERWHQQLSMNPTKVKAGGEAARAACQIARQQAPGTNPKFSLLRGAKSPSHLRSSSSSSY